MKKQLFSQRTAHLYGGDIVKDIITDESYIMYEGQKYPLYEGTIDLLVENIQLKLWLTEILFQLYKQDMDIYEIKAYGLRTDLREHGYVAENGYDGEDAIPVIFHRFDSVGKVAFEALGIESDVILMEDFTIINEKLRDKLLRIKAKHNISTIAQQEKEDQ